MQQSKTWRVVVNERLGVRKMDWVVFHILLQFSVEPCEVLLWPVWSLAPTHSVCLGTKGMEGGHGFPTLGLGGSWSSALLRESRSRDNFNGDLKKRLQIKMRMHKASKNNMGLHDCQSTHWSFLSAHELNLIFCASFDVPYGTVRMLKSSCSNASLPHPRCAVSQYCDLLLPSLGFQGVALLTRLWLCKPAAQATCV